MADKKDKKIVPLEKKQFNLGNIIFNVGLWFTYSRVSKKRQNDLSVEILRDKLRADSLSSINASTHCWM